MKEREMSEFSYIVDTAAKVQKVNSLQELHKEFTKEIEAIGTAQQTCISLIKITTPLPNAILLYITDGAPLSKAEEQDIMTDFPESPQANKDTLSTTSISAEQNASPKEYEDGAGEQEFYLVTGSDKNNVIQFKSQECSSFTPPPLSPREKECLYWAAKGLSDHDIGDLLSLSPTTVTGYMKNVRHKFKVRTRIQAVVIATSCGIITP
ncbi:hypothetical protein CRD36_03685 [Paremcibacter congregatus]|uniref:HTH luxR-type domain-containing protein n=2 Tax=Paremcibacter congregatus TaxID=2043170 RepID=A0A2G4YTY0_9PROT|nr:hypothetical protein CRD36_03685 [Paremcibacter congregatus]QDE26755.1 helix-turn-helix transcriptional regulator [Paremcibacter congregatus]